MLGLVGVEGDAIADATLMLRQVLPQCSCAAPEVENGGARRNKPRKSRQRCELIMVNAALIDVQLVGCVRHSGIMTVELRSNAEQSWALREWQSYDVFSRYGCVRGEPWTWGDVAQVAACA